MQKKILMLGGTGTLSKTIAIDAYNMGHDVTVLNRGRHGDLLPEKIEKIKGDFYNIDSIQKCLNSKKFDIIIDFLSRKRNDIERIFPILANKCTQYVFISSCCVFRRSPEDFPIVEDSPKPNTDWKYNVEKFEAEQSLMKLSTEYKSCNYTIVRPYITYDEHRIPIAIAPSYAFHQTIIERIKHGKPMLVIDDGQAISTVTYVEDFAKGVLGLLGNSLAYNEDFNVVGDFQYTHKEILETLYEKLGSKPNIVAIPRNTIAKYLTNYSEMILGDRALDAKFDNAKLKKVVPGITFNYDLNKGLDKVLEYYNKAGSTAPIDFQYEGQIDQLLNKVNVSSGYCKYASKNQWLTYTLYKVLPFKFAQKINRIFRRLTKTR
jgi:nucleoside-diphosphate-sugar epimerase